MNRYIEVILSIAILLITISLEYGLLFYSGNSSYSFANRDVLRRYVSFQVEYIGVHPNSSYLIVENDSEYLIIISFSNSSADLEGYVYPIIADGSIGEFICILRKDYPLYSPLS